MKLRDLLRKHMRAPSEYASPADMALSDAVLVQRLLSEIAKHTDVVGKSGYHVVHAAWGGKRVSPISLDFTSEAAEPAPAQLVDEIAAVLAA